MPKTAQQMFEALGYELIKLDETIVWYSKRDYEHYYSTWLISNIYFNRIDKSLIFTNQARNFDLTEIVEYSLHTSNVFLDISLLNAIHQQLKELGWLDE